MIAAPPPPALRVSVCRPQFAVSGPPQVHVVAAGPAGRTGPQGDPGPATPDLSLAALEDLGGHRAVRWTPGGVLLASSANPGEALSVLGVTVGAAAQGAPAQIRVSGELVEPSWSWSPGPIYLGSNGALTQVPPAGAVVLEMGAALSPTSMLVRVQLEIFDG